MNYTVHLDFNLSLFALVIILLLAWGGFRGYKIGAVIMSVSLFALITATYIAALISFEVYQLLSKSTVPEIFGSILLAITFSAAIWLSNIVHSATLKRVSPTQNDRPNKTIGIFLGIIKFFIITSIYATILLNLDCRGHFLPRSERNNFLFNLSSRAITSVITELKMDKNIKDCYPNEQFDIETNTKDPKNQQDNNNTKQKNKKNQNSNTSIPVEDIQKP